MPDRPDSSHLDYESRSGQVDRRPNIIYGAIKPPIPNYTLSTVCPNCAAPTHRRACKVRCDRCGFVWDCSEL